MQKTASGTSFKDEIEFNNYKLMQLPVCMISQTLNNLIAMKTKKIIIPVLLLFLACTAGGQEYKIPVQNTKDGRLILVNFPGDLPLEGYSGNEIVITSTGGDFAPPERAKGLKPIYPGGNDNSGLGLNVEKNGSEITVTCILPITRQADYKLRVPENISVQIESGCERGTDITVTGMKSEIEIKNCQGIKITNCSGPLVLSTIAGDIEIDYGKAIPEEPVSVSAISGEVNMVMPSKTAANLELKTTTGSFYSDFDFTMPKNNMKRVGGAEVEYALNGGGKKISITTVAGNVYIRKGL